MGRRNSADFSFQAIDGPRVIAPKASDWSPQPLERFDEPAHEIPPQWRARVVFQATDAPEKEWRGWFTEEDTEFDVERRAHKSLGILGAWRRASFWRDESGLLIVMTNSRKEIPLRYSSEADPEIKEIQIGEDDSVRVILTRLKAKSNFHLTDHASRPFGINDYPFGYVSASTNHPLKLLHGSALMGKIRDPTPRKDNRVAVEVKVGDAKSVYARTGPGAPQGYSRLLSDMVIKHGITEACHIDKVRAENDRISVEIAPGPAPDWFTEKICPPLMSYFIT
jgi:hypothetical protein